MPEPAPVRVRPVSPLTIILAVTFLFSCSGEPPEILYPDGRISLLLDPGTGEIAEILSLYVALRESDGMNEPSRLFLVHEGEELSWELQRNEWVQFEHAGDQWYGMPDIRMPDGESLPRGRYRIIVEDTGLLRDEADYYLTADPTDRAAAFPRLRIEGRTLHVLSETDAILRVYNRAGRLVVNRAVAPGMVPDEVTVQIPDETGLQAFVMTGGQGVRRESGPYSLVR